MAVLIQLTVRAIGGNTLAVNGLLGYRTDRAATATEIALAVGYAVVVGLLLLVARTADRAARATFDDPPCHGGTVPGRS